MDKNELESNYKNEDFYWWFMGRRKIISTLVKHYLVAGKNYKFLDAGCGTGIILKDLSSFGQTVGIDVSVEALNLCKKRGINNLVQGDISLSLPFKDGSFDYVVILGVLYSKSIRNEANVLGELFRVTKLGGLIVLSEGAFKILMSRHNERVGAVRRYYKDEMKAMVERAGFKILKISYWNMLLFPLFLLAKVFDAFMPSHSRGLADMELPLPGFINSIFSFILYLEASMLKFTNLPFGTSIVTVGIKA